MSEQMNGQDSGAVKDLEAVSPKGGEDSAALKAEVERLKAENERLKESGGGAASAVVWRWIFSVILIVIASLSLVSAIGAYWLSNTLLDTETYVATIAPLADEPAIQGAVADIVTEQVMAKVDVQGLAEQYLPEQLQLLAPTFESAVQGFVHDKTLALVKSEQFKTLWIEANRKSHELAIGALTAEGGDVVAIDDNGTVSIDLAPIAQQLATTVGLSGDRLSAAVASLGDGGQVVLVESPVFGQARAYVEALRVAGTGMPLMTLALLAGAIAVAPDRRKALMWSMVGFALATASLGVTIGASREALVSGASAAVSPAVSTAVFDVLTVGLVLMVRTIFVLTIVVAAGAAVAGPSRGAVALRGGVHDVTDRMTSGRDFGTFGAWIHDHLSLLRMGVAGIGLGTLVFWPQPTPATVLWVAGVTVIVYFLLELFGRAPGAATKDDSAQ